MRGFTIYPKISIDEIILYTFDTGMLFCGYWSFTNMIILWPISKTNQNININMDEIDESDIDR